MKKIMFNDLYGLTKAVIDGHKTMTRRFVPDRMAQLLDVSSKGVLIIPKNSIPDSMNLEQFAEEFAKHPGVITFEENDVKEVKPAIDIREECIKLAPYKVGEVVAVAQSYSSFRPLISHNDDYSPSHPGWTNKMFVRADLMPHQIEITGIRVEHLQDITDKDCIAEGIINGKAISMYTFTNAGLQWGNPRLAFSALIDKPGVGGPGTWESNPWVFAYSFKKIK